MLRDVAALHASNVALAQYAVSAMRTPLRGPVSGDLSDAVKCLRDCLAASPEDGAAARHGCACERGRARVARGVLRPVLLARLGGEGDRANTEQAAADRSTVGRDRERAAGERRGVYRERIDRVGPF